MKRFSTTSKVKTATGGIANPLMVSRQSLGQVNGEVTPEAGLLPRGYLLMMQDHADFVIRTGSAQDPPWIGEAKPDDSASCGRHTAAAGVRHKAVRIANPLMITPCRVEKQPS
jgi:hypothetical protein